MQDEKTKILNWLSEAYQDEWVKKEPDLSKVLLEAAQKIEKNEAPQMVLARLDRQLSLFVVSHNLHVPEALTTLQKQIKLGTNWLSQGISRGTTLL